jgi:hypothetical protein
MLEREGLSIADITAVPKTPLSAMTEALRNGEVDAVVIWEPESENSAQVLGDDLVELRARASTRAVQSQHHRANLADPVKRAKIVRFVYAVLFASDAIQTDPARAQALVTAAGGFSAEDVRDSWRHHGFIADIPADLLDVLEQEERWLAEQDKRPARSRDELARLIDTSVFARLWPWRVRNDAPDPLALAALLLAPAAQAQDLAHETAQVEDLRSIREIKRLQAEWGYRAIAGDWKGMAALGTDYVEMVLPGGNREGREAVENGLRSVRRRPTAYRPDDSTAHVVQPGDHASAMGDRATGRWRHLAMLGRTAFRRRGAAPPTWSSTTRPPTAGGSPSFALRQLHRQLRGRLEEPGVPDRAPFHYTPDEAGTLLPIAWRRRPQRRGPRERGQPAVRPRHCPEPCQRVRLLPRPRDVRRHRRPVRATATIDVAGQGVYNGPPECGNG